jgi:regulator of RNase E activity RraA
LFELKNGSFRALDAATRRELFKSEVPVDVSGMAIANGHVCFGDAKGTLYCFGFPVEL